MKRILLAVAMFALASPALQQRAQARVDVSIDFFYDNLGDGGSWVEVGDYGYCWQPTVAVSNTSWRPYRWLLGLYGSRLDLDFVRGFRLGDLSLRPMDPPARARLGLGAGTRMGPGLGFVAHRGRLRRLGAAAAATGRRVLG